MAQEPFRTPEDPLEELAESQPELQGAAATALDCSSNIYEKQELLHRPHAFALMHGDGGVKVAYGQLQWRIDTITLQFETSTASGVSVTVDDHPDHTHEPHSSHTHTAGVASHDHDHSHTHEHDHTHTAGVASHTHEHVHTHTAGVASHTHPITDDIHQGHTGAGTGGSGTDLFGSGSYNSGDSDEYTHDHGGATQSNDTAASGTVTTSSPDDATTGDVNGGSGTVTTSSPDDSTTGVPNNITTGNVNSGSGTVVTSGPTPALTHSGVKDVSDGTSSAPTGVLQHNVTVSGGLNTITYCSGAAQDPISNINVQIPKVDVEDGPAMEPTTHGKDQNDPYHQLSSYGEVYLVWVVNLENAGTEVEKCWVQVGEPTGDQISEITMGTATTNRRTATDPSDGTGVGEGEDKGVFKMKIGTVASESSQIVQNITSDVVWTTTVMDRLFV